MILKIKIIIIIINIIGGERFLSFAMKTSFEFRSLIF